MTTPTTL